MKTLERIELPYNTGRAFIVRKGQRVKIEGESVVDFVAFNLNNLRERFDQARTKVNQGKIFISTNDKLISKFSNVMLTIVEDTYKEGTHDLEKGMCSKSSYQKIFEKPPYKSWSGVFGERGSPPDHGCWENLSEALKPWKIMPEDIPSPFNIFETMKIDAKTGKLEFSEVTPKPGSYVDFRAEMDCLVGVSACPDAGRGKPVKVIVYSEDEK